MMYSELTVNMAYIIASILFIAGIKMLSSPETAPRGNLVSASGMLLAVVVTLFDRQVIDYRWIALGLVIGSTIGALAARLTAMTAMPEMVALFNGFGGLASLLVGWEVYERNPDTSLYTAVTVYLTVLIGGVTFTGSMVAWGKLAGILPGRPVLFRGQKAVNVLLAAAVLTLGALYAIDPGSAYYLFLAGVSAALLLGISSVIPIGGADMPVVISLLNSYSGLAACAAGFVIGNNVLIVSGALVGASGIILTRVMCRAMNRSLANVLFGGFGSKVPAPGVKFAGEAKTATPEDTYFVLEAARSVLIVPGYGMALARAQHAARELGETLEANGTEVRYAIHPVAGRMPGHMNVLLAEANVPYDQLAEMDDVNPVMDTVDAVLVIGANDVVNPAAKEEPGSPIYGMPVIEVDRARTVYVLKRSMAAGFAGVDNPLFFKPNTWMVFGDAKNTLQQITAKFKD